jgi:hypothetical protein
MGVEGDLEDLPDLRPSSDPGIEKVGSLIVEGGACPGAVLGEPLVKAQRLVDVLGKCSAAAVMRPWG